MSDAGASSVDLAAVADLNEDSHVQFNSVAESGQVDYTRTISDAGDSSVDVADSHRTVPAAVTLLVGNDSSVQPCGSVGDTPVISPKNQSMGGSSSAHSLDIQRGSGGVQDIGAPVSSRVSTAAPVSSHCSAVAQMPGSTAVNTAAPVTSRSRLGPTTFRRGGSRRPASPRVGAAPAAASSTARAEAPPPAGDLGLEELRSGCLEAGLWTVRPAVDDGGVGAVGLELAEPGCRAVTRVRPSGVATARSGSAKNARVAARRLRPPVAAASTADAAVQTVGSALPSSATASAVLAAALADATDCLVARARCGTARMVATTPEAGYGYSGNPCQYADHPPIERFGSCDNGGMSSAAPPVKPPCSAVTAVPPLPLRSAGPVPPGTPRLETPQLTPRPHSARGSQDHTRGSTAGPRPERLFHSPIMLQVQDTWCRQGLGEAASGTLGRAAGTRRLVSSPFVKQLPMSSPMRQPGTPRSLGGGIGVLGTSPLGPDSDPTGLGLQGPLRATLQLRAATPRGERYQSTREPATQDSLVMSPGEQLSYVSPADQGDRRRSFPEDKYLQILRNLQARGS